MAAGIESLNISQIWTVAATLGGFQVVALAWRISREVYMEERNETTWLTLTDGFVALSFLVLIGGVFLAPMWGVATTDVIKLLGLALVIFAPSVFVLAGHYNLYCDWGIEYDEDGDKLSRDRCTKQEGLVVVIAVMSIAVYGILAWSPALG